MGESVLMSAHPTSPSIRWKSERGAAVALLAIAVGAACGSPSDAPAHDAGGRAAGPAALDPERAMGVPLDALRAAYAAAAADADRFVATADGVAHARRAAALGRVLVLRDPDGTVHLDDVRALLRE